MRHWATSIALHGAVVGAAALLWLESPPEKPVAVLRWDVALVAPDPEPVSHETPPEPERPKVEPKPSPPLPVPRDRPAPRPLPPDPEPALIKAPDSVTQEVAKADPAPEPVKRADPAPQPDTTAARAEEVERRWYLALMEKLRAMKRYPMVARKLGQEGVVLVEARFGSDGSLLGLELKRGSGFPVLDSDALKLIQSATEAARNELRPERPARLDIPIAYKLEG